MSTPKLVKDGMVAVLVSPGFGAGWSTWASEAGEEMVFDPTLAQMLLDEASYDDLATYAKSRYPEEYGGGLGDLEVRWVAEGERFVIREYDGHESLETFGPDWGFIA